MISQLDHPLFKLATSTKLTEHEWSSRQLIKTTDREEYEAQLVEDFKTRSKHIQELITRHNSQLKENDVPIPEYYMHLGPFGETLLHVACLFGHYGIVKFMIDDLGPEKANHLINQQYLEQPFKGETALHISIARGDIPLVELLLKNGASLSKRCMGHFFHPPRLYVGDLPLTFAACIKTPNDSNKEMFDIIMKHVEDHAVPPAKSEENDPVAIEQTQIEAKRDLLKARDKYKGNTILHILVMTGNIEMYDYIVQNYSEEAEILEKEENTAHVTPLVLCAQLGNPQFFNFLVKRQREVHWKYGKTSFSYTRE